MAHSRRRLKQFGFTAIELLAALVITGLLVSVAVTELQRYLRTLDLRSAGYEQGAATIALANYIAANNVKLQSILAGGTGITVACGAANCVNPLAPTPAELIAAGYTTVPVNAKLGGSYAFKVVGTPSGNIEGQTSRTVPITIPGSPQISPTELAIVAKFAMSSAPTLANNVGWSTTATPTVISGPAGQWTRTNPGAGAGVVMMLAQYNASTWAAYCQQGGNCTMNQMTSNNLNSTTGTINTLTSTTANVTNISGQTLSYNNGTITTLTGSTATIPDITGNLNGNATTSNTSGYANTAGSVPCSGITGSNANLCTGVYNN